MVATNGNQRQIEGGPKRRKQAKTVAVGCDQLPTEFHGKEGVGGSSPPEGSAKKRRKQRFFVCSVDPRAHEGADGAACGASASRTPFRPALEARVKPSGLQSRVLACAAELVLTRR